MDRVCFRFEGFELDLAARELRGPDDSIELERQVFDVLAYLVEHHDRVVPKSELLDEIWGDRFVSESALSSRIKSARRAIDDDGDRQRLIRTTRGVGFRFVGDVQTVTTGDIEDHRPVSSTVVEPVEPLIGRGPEASQLATSIVEHRLVTLIGPGGIGKTHLMRHTGALAAKEFDDGAALVDLTTIVDASAVASTVARQVGAAQLADSTVEQSVLYHLAQKHLLLLIDNAEHVRAGVAELCASMLSACPHVSLVVTSRERLDIAGERLVPVAPLSIDDSIEMFASRASAHAVDVDRSATDLRDLCERLDGMPLAIQLAASRTRMLSLADIASRLRDHLATQALDVTDRHASMDRAIAWSFDSLDVADQRALGALSLLRGTFDLDDASAVIGEDGLDTVVRLAERSFIVPVAGAGSRFRILEPIRMFASAGHRDDTATARYIAHYVAAAEAADSSLESDEAIDRGAAEFRERWPNIRGAFEEAMSCGDLAAARKITLAASMFAELWLQLEVADWALTSAGGAGPVDADDSDRAALLAVASRLLAHTGARDRAAVLAGALEQASPTPHVIQARLWSAWYRGDVAGLGEQLDLLEAHVDTSRGATALAVRTLRLFAISISGTPDTSASAALRSLASRSGGTGHPLALLADGVDAFWERRYVDAVLAFDRSIDAAAEHGQMLLASGVATYRSIALASMIHDDRVVTRLIAHLDAVVRSGEHTPAGRVGALVVGNLGVLADVTVAALALAVRGERTAAAQALGVRHASGYHSYTTEWIAALAVATLIEADRDRFDREFDVGTGLDLERAAGLTLDALRALDVPSVSAGFAIEEKQRRAATP